MQRRAFELQLPTLETADENPLVPEIGARLGEIAAPTLVAVAPRCPQEFDRVLVEFLG